MSKKNLIKRLNMLSNKQLERLIILNNLPLGTEFDIVVNKEQENNLICDFKVGCMLAYPRMKWEQDEDGRYTIIFNI